MAPSSVFVFSSPTPNPRAWEGYFSSEWGFLAQGLDCLADCPYFSQLEGVNENWKQPTPGSSGGGGGIGSEVVAEGVEHYYMFVQSGRQRTDADY